jgi:hypothetical protein
MKRTKDHDFLWPSGRHVAAVVNVAYEAWSDGHAPGIGPMGNALPHGAFDTNARSWGDYGRDCGIDRLLHILDRAKVTASIMVSGITAERWSERSLSTIFLTSRLTAPRSRSWTEAYNSTTRLML